MTNLRNRARAQQIVSFEGMVRRGRLAPTDIDGFQEYNGVLFIYFEGKVISTDMDLGQKMAFEHVCESYYNPDEKDYKKLKHFAWTLVFEHNVPAELDIVAKDQYVTNVYSSIQPEWRTPKSVDVVPKFKLDTNDRITLLDAIIQIEVWCRENGIRIDR